MRTDSEIEKLIIDNTSLTHFVLHKYFSHLAYDEDYQQIALIGLWKAARNYNETKGQFSTLAVTVIRNDILHQIERGNAPCRGAGYITVSLENELAEDITLEDSLASEANIEDEVIESEYFKNILGRLPGRDKEIVAYRLLGYSQNEIAKKCGVTQVRVCRVCKKAGEMLKEGCHVYE